jgi:hypothetical protein
MASGGVYHDLLSRCVDILESYDPETMGVDTHTEIYLSSKLPSDYEESSVTLVTEVFAGCVQYNKLLQVVNDTFHSKDGRNFKKHDAHLFRVIAYLAIFRLEELGMAHFRRFVTSQPVSKMHKFLNFLFDEKNLKTLLNDEWCKVYDQTFVQTHVLSPIFRWHPEVQELVKYLGGKLANIQKPRSVQPPTEVKPFQLTRPRPRTVPTPEEIPKLQPRKPIPKSTYHMPTTLQLIVKAKETNKAKAKSLVEEAARAEFACARVDPQKKKQLVQSILEAEDAK